MGVTINGGLTFDITKKSRDTKKGYSAVWPSSERHLNLAIFIFFTKTLQVDGKIYQILVKWMEFPLLHINKHVSAIVVFRSIIKYSTTTKRNRTWNYAAVYDG